MSNPQSNVSFEINAPPSPAVPATPQTSWQRFRASPVVNWVCQKENALLLAVITGVLVGMGGGALLRFAEPSERAIMLIQFPGEMFMNVLTLLIVPLIMTSLMSGVSNLDLRSSGRIAQFTLLYYMITTLTSLILSMTLMLVVRPGEIASGPRPEGGDNEEADSRSTVLDTFLDLIRNFFPPNLFQALIEQSKTGYEKVTRNRTICCINNTYDNGTWELLNYTEIRDEDKRVIGVRSGTNVLGIVFFSIFFGVVLSRLAGQADVVKRLADQLNSLIMDMLTLVMYIGPLGFCLLIMGNVLEMSNPGRIFSTLGAFLGVCVFGLAFHCFLTLPLLYFLGTFKNPFAYMRGMVTAMITGLGTSSSATALPATFRCIEEKLGIHRTVTRFLLPVGASINLDGNAIYEAAAGIFICQLNDSPLNIGQIVSIYLTITLASIGAAASPSSSLVTVAVVLNSMGLPGNDVSLIFAIDWLIDRLRTSVNIAGDGFGAGIVAHLCRGLLRRQSQAQLALSPSSQQFGASNASDGESNNSNGGNGGGTGAIALSKQESVAGGLEMKGFTSSTEAQSVNTSYSQERSQYQPTQQPIDSSSNRGMQSATRRAQSKSPPGQEDRF